MPANNTSVRFSDYYNSHLPGDLVEAVFFRANRPVQSREFNELQSVLSSRMDGIAYAMYKDGSIVSGAEILILRDDPSLANIELKDGKIFVRASVYDVPGEKLTIPFDTRVAVGLRFRTYEVNEMDNASLLNPAVGADTFGEPGAGRLMSEFHWGWSADSGGHDARSEWQFFPIYEVDHGVVVIKRPPPMVDNTLATIARYDREANGNYVASGLRTSFTSETESAIVLNIEQGVANIYGYKVERQASTRFQFLKDPDTREARNEPHAYAPAPDGRFYMTVNHGPISSVTRIVGMKEKTITVTRGPISGTTDTLPDDSIVSVSSITQAAVTFAPTNDYNSTGDTINWSPAGAEPLPGSAYQVTYRYLTDVTPIEIRTSQVVLSGLVVGSFVQIDYFWKMPRVDLIVLNREGAVDRIKGVSQVRLPQPPSSSDDNIELAQVIHDWMTPPRVSDTAVRAFKMSQQQALEGRVDNLYDLVALGEMKHEIALRDPTSKYGVFVDAFNNDDLRDQGRPQSAAIYDGVLSLSNSPTPVTPSGDAVGEFQTLPYELVVLVEQPNKTGCMKINPYAAFEPVPAEVTLSPSSDRWANHVTLWASPVSQLVDGRIKDAYHQWGAIYQSRTTSAVQVASRWMVNEVYMRQISVQFTIKGFGPAERLVNATFDGLNVTPP
jgi:hypothetical protein